MLTERKIKELQKHGVEPVKLRKGEFGLIAINEEGMDSLDELAIETGQEDVMAKDFLTSVGFEEEVEEHGN